MRKKKEEDGRFNKFGIVSFTSNTKTNDFIDYLEKGQVVGSRCEGCGRVFFPPRADCYQCLSSNMEWFEISGKGKLVTFSRLEYAPAGFEADLPYCIALVDYGNYRVFGRMAHDIPENEIKPGMAVTTVVHMLSDGQLTYFFQKALG